MQRPPVVSRPIRFQSFVGRDAELEHLLARRREAAGARGGAVLIAGDPGIGKSRLVHEFCSRLPRRPSRFASAAYREFAQRPLAPLLELLAQLDPGTARALGVHPQSSKAAYLAAFVDAFERLAVPGTTVLVLEDLHWADREGLQILHALAERAGSCRLLFVATYRAAEVGPTHPNFSLIGRLLRERTVSAIELEPLAAKQVAELLRSVSGARQLSPAMLDDVRRRCDGNAFFAEELLRGTIDRYEAGESPSARSMPLSVQAALRDRLAALSHDAQALLEAASLFGRRFDPELLRSIVPTGATPQSFADALEQLVRLALVEPHDASTGEYRFRHALLRETVYGDVDPIERRALHHRIADAIAVRPDADRYAEALAHHFWHAGERERAALYCLAAAETARSLHAYEDATDWYERAAQGLQSYEEIARALAIAAQTAFYGDQIDRMMGFYRLSIDLSARAGRIDDVVFTSVLMASMMYDGGRSADAVALFEETRRRWSDLAGPVARDRLLLRLGLVYASSRRVDAAWDCVASIDEATLEPNSLLAAERLFLRSGLHAQRAQPAAWQADFESAFAIFENLDAIPDNRRVALSNVAGQALHLGDVEAAHAYQTRAFELACDIRSHDDHERILLAQIDLHAGRLGAARAHLRATEPAARFASRVERALLEAWLALLLDEEIPAAARDASLVEEAAAGGYTSALVRLACAFAPLWSRRNRAAEADALLARAASLVETPFGMTFAIAALAGRRAELVEPIRALVATAAEREHDRVDRALLALIDAARLRAAGDPAARDHARAAARGFADIGWLWLEAQALELGGDRKLAAQSYRRIGAVGEVRRLEGEPVTRDDGTRHGSVLTSRERELVRLVAEGEGNRAAAQRLSITEKAVEKHLTSIYAKLGMASRVQLAAYVAKGGFNDAPPAGERSG